MLVGGNTFARYRVAYLLAAVVLFCVPAFGWYLAARLGWVDRPSGSTSLGLILGIVAAAIIAFEMLLWPRKKWRGRRLGRTRAWMYWHIWLGLLSLPLAVGHAGFRFGGPLTSAVLVLFLLVIASGIWGLALQQVLPQRLLDKFMDETIETEVDRVMAFHRRKADDLIDAVASCGQADALRTFHVAEVGPYLEHGRASGSVLQSAARSAGLFADLTERAPEAAPTVQKLQELCAARRQYDAQVRIHYWLHNWQMIHLPLSVALCVVLAVHIVTALKYW